ncbi:MAG: ABC transporter substrate-binding protein [Actinomycetota bacterium]
MAERIVSLLPSATEVLWFLGHGDRVVGVTFECEYPAEAASRPRITDTIVPPGLAPGEIDAFIGAAVEAGRDLYTLDRDGLATLDPDLIVSQDLCRVCAMPAGDVDAAVASLGCRADVFSYDPMTLDGVLAEMVALDRLVRSGATAVTDTEPEPAVVTALRERLAAVADRVAGRPKPAVLLLEWPDPPFTPGHWIPDLISAAGGTPLLAHPGARSEATTWDAVASCGAEVLLVAPCGFDEAAAGVQLAEVVARPELADLPAIRAGRTHPIDADGLIVRPGPRLVDGVEALAALLHPDA